MSEWIPLFNAAAAIWLEALLRASWQGGAALLVVWLISRTTLRIPPPALCWLWRLAWVKLLVALCWATPIDVPVPVAPRAVVTTMAAQQVPGVERPLATKIAKPLPARAQPARVASASSAPARSSAVQLAPAAYFLVVWLACVAALLAKVVREGRAARALRRRCVPTRDAALCGWLQELVRSMGLRGAPELLEVEALASPLLVAGRPPAVVLPTSLLHTCTETECRLMLAHELAHVQRGDLQWGWLTAAVQVLFFFHPLVWLARREYGLAQEAACDRIAVAAARAGTAAYGELLLKVAALPARGFQAGFAPLGGTDQCVHTLRRRLKMLQRVALRSASGRPGNSVWGSRVGIATTVLLGITFVVPWRVTAQEQVAPSRPAANSEFEQARRAVQAPTGAAPMGSLAEAAPADDPEAQPSPAQLPEVPATAPLAGPGVSAVAEQWEDVLLLEAMRYLKLTGEQVAQVRALSRPTDERLKKLGDEEKRTLAALERIARRNREALLAGEPGRQQDDALLLKRNAQQKRARTEQELVEWLMPRIMHTLTREQMVRAILLTLGEPVKDRDRVFGTALLDPAAGFVLQTVQAAPTVEPGQLVRNRVDAVWNRWGQRRDQQVRDSLAQKYPADVLAKLSPDRFYSAGSTLTFNKGMVKFAEKLDGDLVLNLVGTSIDVSKSTTDPQVAAAMKEFETLRGGAQAPASQVLATEAKPEELQDALRPFVRRFMLSPRLRSLLEERRR